ncbi:MAG: hypothetical protein JXJ17_17100 [Anaerolineae bacterium]|nr:hypothetical protein [Anaerolineae bacterium]
MTVLLRETYYSSGHPFWAIPGDRRSARRPLTRRREEPRPAIRCHRLAEIAREQGLAENDVEGAFVHALPWLRPAMIRHLWYVLHLRNWRMIDDVVAEAVETILREIRQGREIYSILRYARTVAHNVGCDYLNRESRQQRIEEEIVLRTSRSLGYSISAEDAYLAQQKERQFDQRLEILARVVDDLPDDNLHRSIIQLRLQGLSLPEVARQLELTEGELYGRYNVAREMLRARIEAIERAPLRDEYIDWVFENIDELTDSAINRAVLDLRMQGYNLAEVGERLDISHTAAARRFYRIRQAIESERVEVPARFPFSLG